MILFNPSFTWLISLFEKISSKLNTNKVEQQDDGFTDVNNLSNNSYEDKVNDLLMGEKDPIDEPITPEILEMETIENEEKSIDLEPVSEPKEKIKTNDSLDEEFSVEVASSDDEPKEDIETKLKEFGEYDPKLDLSEYKLKLIF